jgi:UDP-N-acetylglucosamine acyltransferase
MNRLTIHQTAIVHPNAELESEVEIGPYCLVGEHVRIGKRTRLLGHVVVNGRTTIGEEVTIHPFATVGTPSQDRKAVPGEVCFTTIGNRTVLREYVSVQRGTGENAVTAIGADCLLLAYVHIAHNCVVGNFVTMSNLAQLAGHVRVEDHASIGGATGVHQFVRIGRYSFVGGMTRLARDVPPFFLIEGNPPKVFGLNGVGLRRANFSTEAMSELKACYKMLYHSGRNVSQAVAVLSDIVKTEAGRELLAFVRASSERGIVK